MLLVGMYISAATVEESMGVSQRTKTEYHMIQQFYFWVISGKKKTKQ